MGRNGYRYIFAKIHTGRYNKVPVQIVAGVIHQNTARTCIITHLGVYRRLVSTDKHHKDTTKVQWFVGAIFYSYEV